MAAVSAQRNFIEYSNFFILMCVLLVLLQANPLSFAVLNSIFLLGRCLHAYGLICAESKEKPNYKFRTAGMISTFVAIILASLYAFVLALGLFL